MLYCYIISYIYTVVTVQKLEIHQVSNQVTHNKWGLRAAEGLES